LIHSVLPLREFEGGYTDMPGWPVIMGSKKKYLNDYLELYTKHFL